MSLLLQDFYTLDDYQTPAPDRVLAQISINRNHDIFRGHFPGHPVTPGVCMMQIIKEIGERWAAVPLLLQTARNVKFMSVINPEADPSVQLEIQVETTEADQVAIKCTAYHRDTIALKFNGVFQKIY